MIYKVSKMVDSREIDQIGTDAVFRDVIHKLIEDIPIQDLEAAFKLSRTNGEEYTLSRERTYIFSAKYSNGVASPPPPLNPEVYPKMEFSDLMSEMVLYSVLQTDDTVIGYSDTGVYSLDVIMSAVCRVHGVDKAFVCKHTRKRPHVTYRHEFYYLASKFSDCSLLDIGWYCGGYDHATVMHGAKEILNLLSTPGNQKIKTDMQLIFLKLRMPEANTKSGNHITF